MAFLWAFSSSKRSKQMRFHSRGGASSAPRSAIRPTRSMQFSWTFSWRFFKIGVKRGSRSLIGGVIFVIPMTFTIAFIAPKIDPRTSGYSSPKYSYKKRPKWPIICSSPHCFMTTEMRAIKSAACCRTRADGVLSRQRMIPAICGKYGFTRAPREFTTVPKPLSMTVVSSEVCSWNAYTMPSMICSSRRESMSATPRLAITLSMVSITIFRYGSDASFKSSTILPMMSAPPTLFAISTVVSTNCR
mmetsp:Transcript_86974/g.243812  ORF Transcript_86974/g.243812 Transcript_86974/m.243812 type:complete len:245 (+) Transcript_86974:819-1553(+)